MFENIKISDNQCIMKTQ